MKLSPPGSSIRFLRWFCREDYIDELEGDLIELFEKDQSDVGNRARWRFTLNVVRHLRPEYMKLFHRKRNLSSSNNLFMIGNYLTIALRNLRKRTAFSFINIFGLAMGVSACLVILKYIDFETSYDSFHDNAQSVYRINRAFIKNQERGQAMIPTTYGLGPALADQIPEVKQFVRLHGESAILSTKVDGGETKAFHEGNIALVDSTFFKVFTFKAGMGNLVTSLDNPNSIILTASIARKYFGNDDPIGKIIHNAGERMEGNYTVTAVMDDLPQNSHFNFNILMPIRNVFLSQQYREDDGWMWNNFTTYVQLNPAASAQAVEQKLPAFCDRNINPKWKASGGIMELTLQPLRDIHLHPGLRHDVDTVSRSTIYFFGVIAVFILFIAWINYINLSTARAMERSREVGIKKAIGAYRIELIIQFICESVVINFIAMIIAVGLSILLVPVLGQIINKNLVLDISDTRLWMVMTGLFIVGTLASGVYPAFVLSAFRITSVIKGLTADTRGFSLRKGLVVFQFTSSLMLIAGTFLVYRQITFMQNQDKGLQMDQMLIVAGPGAVKGKVAQERLITFKEEASKIVGVKAVATSAAVPAGGYNWGADIRKIGAPIENMKTGCVVWVDPDFIPTYKIPFVAGKNFNSALKSDMKSVIINEAAVVAFDLGSAEEALNTQLILQVDTVNVIGVLKNYNWSSLKSEVVPFVLAGDTIEQNHISLHLEAGAISSAVESVDKLYRELLPNEPFEYRFLDDTFNAQYKSDQQFGNIFGLFAGLAVAISCLGLWGLAAFTTAQKLKEIGVRKVLGASIGSIMYLLCSRFMKLVLISAVIATPLIWFGMDSWLSSFAFRVVIGLELFVVPIILLGMIALLTVSIQVLKGARLNPAKVLRAE